MRNARRGVCFPIMSRIHYARQKHLLRLLKAHPKIELQLVAGGSMLLERYAEKFLPAIKKDGFQIAEALFNVIEGGHHVAMARTAGLAALEFSNVLYRLNPDIVLIRGDRFEQLALAMVASYLNKTIAHIEGGDLTGTIDESVRHAITKLSHIHFVTNEPARRRLVQMGENPKRVFNVGSPDTEFASLVKKKFYPATINDSGVGHTVDFKKPFVIVIYHPVTTELNNRESAEKLLKAVGDLNTQAVWFWPNNDAGTAEIAKAIRIYREKGFLRNDKIRFVTDILPEDFIALLKKSSVFVGNSSAGIKECSYLGVPAVNIGTRQQGRLRGPNVLDVRNDSKAIKAAIEKQLRRGPYKPSLIYYRPGTSKKIADILSKTDLYVQKKFYDHQS